jgi:flagellar hook-basal body complex protein FliE
MTFPPISSVAGASGINSTQSAAAAPKAAAGFGDTISSALEAVSDAEFTANALAEDIATGGEASVQELMTSMTKAQLSVDLLVQVRNKAVEAYQEIMRMQI